MTCEDLRPDYLLYAMGTMVEAESGELRAHLARGCQTCTEGLRQAHAVAYSMGAVLKGPEAPRDLRGRVLAISGVIPEAEPRPRLVTRERRPRFWVRPIAAWQGLALAAASVVLALAPGVLWYRELSESHAKQAAAASLLEREQLAAASLRGQVAKLEIDAAPHATPIFALELERGGASGEALKQLAIPHGAAAIVLALPADLVRQATSVELRDASEKAIWTVSPLPVSDADSAGLTIPARLLPPGRYSVVLITGEKTLARLSFQATAR